MRLVLLCILVLHFSSLPALRAESINGDGTILKGPYLGQKPPGRNPELFGPGVISVDANFEHSAAVFSPDGQEVFWCTNVNWYTDEPVRGNLRMYYMANDAGEWSAPALFPPTRNLRVERPTFSPDGNRLYFECQANSNNTLDNIDIFVIERTAAGWTDPVPLPSHINSSGWDRIHCIDALGSLYFTRRLMRADEEIYVSKWNGASYSEPERVSSTINSAVRFERPYGVVGRGSAVSSWRPGPPSPIALTLLKNTNRRTPAPRQASSTLPVPVTLMRS